MRRPLADTGWGPGRAVSREDRCRRYLSASRLQVDGAGSAEALLTFPGDAGRGIARAWATRRFAAAYGVDARRRYGVTPASVRVELVVTGPAEAVARFVWALPRTLDYAEMLATQAALDYGRWERHGRAAPYLDGLTADGRRDLARRYRRAAFRVIVNTLMEPPPVEVPEADYTAPPWEQVTALAGGLAAYGWVAVEEVADPQQAARLLAEAEQPGEAAPQWEQAALFDAEDVIPSGPVVIVPCSARKADKVTAPAGQLYTGPLYRAARRAAEALTTEGGAVAIVSARYGLLHPSDVIASYDMRMGRPGSIRPAHLALQARPFGLDDGERDVIVLTPATYTAAVLAARPDAVTPLSGSRGIGEQRSRLAQVARPGTFTVAA
ncbi:hypothetical protein GCM10009801_81980 [Streptomyces albiaxialis]|uniref:DUF6884 domain-containing protein n=1 Tax=Streptomyces albiaxialis TaxID=329523 RepID=A0ABN2X7E7_9ACTN